MSGRYAKLTKNCSLRGWTDVHWAVANWINGNWLKLSKKGFYVAEACDGHTNFNSLSFLPEHYALLDAMIKEGIAQECQEGDSIKPWQQYRKAANPFLKVIQWCVTGRCNLNCRHCYMQSPSERYGELPFKDMVRIIQQFEQANVLQVSLTGGEPFLRKDLLDIMTLLVQKRIGVSEIYSNGLLITEEILAAIKKIGVLPVFQISFDGIGGHDYMRRSNGIEKFVIEAIRKVRAAGFGVNIGTNVDSVNVSSIGKTYELLLNMDRQAWRIGTPLAIGNWKSMTTGLSFDEQANAYVPLVRRWLDDGRPFELVLGQFLRAGGKGQSVDAEDLKILYKPGSFDCGSCRENPNLMPDGTLLPCPGYVDSVLQNRMPNILSDGLSKVWTKSLLRKLANMKKRELISRNRGCRTCKFLGNCGAGCRASALRETGNLMAKDPIACKLWKGKYKQRFHELVISDIQV
jgi:radical SAM protein with 4Fe4S-binding SPASM domain